MLLKNQFKPLFDAATQGLAAIKAVVSWHSERFARIEDDEPLPVRAALFSADQMEQHGKSLATRHQLGDYGHPNRLLKRLDQNEKILINTCDLLKESVKGKIRIAPAGEWLLDNFYLIEEQIRTARLHLPKGYSRRLPRLEEGPSRGLPRVYDIAIDAISHADGRVDAETLSRFVAAYQTVTPLTLGELWAIPIMLRLALIENLRCAAERITTARMHFNQAQGWANRMIDIAERNPTQLILVVADMARSNPPMASPFVAELARRLQGQGPALALPLTWIEQRLAESSQTIEQMVLSENQQQAADQVSISNTIGSLRALGATDWRVFVESLSCVEKVLASDTNGVYLDMDFATRDRYRHVIDRLAKHSQRSEKDIATAAISLAQASAASKGDTHYTAHVGYYLVDDGFTQLSNSVSANLPLSDRIQQGLKRFPLPLYLGVIVILSVIFTMVFIRPAQAAGLQPWPLVLLAGLSLLASSQWATALTNWLATVFIRPQLLPRMDYSRGLPADMRTLVVVPSMLCNAKNIDSLLEALEVRFLGNRDEHLHFALLTDFCDAQEQSLPQDEPLLRQARNGIERLNDKYRHAGNDHFFLFHRSRLYNPDEKRWMGYERKRGKLADLNALLRQRGEGKFSLTVGDLAALQNVRYIITLDSDTQLPRDSARQLAGAMAHPLNRPCYDKALQRVTRGYGILQPRMAANMAGANQSRYAQLGGSEPGIDQYTRSVSDVYQDVFGEGSFIGKGIYDIDAFEQALQDRFPANRILSHDLLEGCYARSGLLSDVELYEDYPTRYEADVSRQRRWIRGDWQIACWLLPRVPGPHQNRLSNPLSLLSRWKIFDNLRRSLVAAALLTLLLLGWFAAPSPWWWTLSVLGIMLLPPAIIAVVDTLHWPKNSVLLSHLAGSMRTAARSFAFTVFRIACLPYEAWFSLDAIVRTSWRMHVTHRHLLEWCASEHAPKRHNDIKASYTAQWAGPVTALITAPALLVMRPEGFFAALPLLVLWLAAPFFAWWLSQPLLRREAKLNANQIVFLHSVARRTWEFFERFVVADDHYLPPDNFQEHPGPIVAHRTSPTNIGMALLANLSARDFGYITTGELLERTEHTFQTLHKLERHLGHFYNWYDTQTLRTLPPRYISSVDSGNLAGHLLTLRAGLQSLPQQLILDVSVFHGLEDTLAVLTESLTDSRFENVHVSLTRLQTQLQDIRKQPPDTLSAMLSALRSLQCTTELLFNAPRVSAPITSDTPTGAAVGSTQNTNNETDAEHWLNAFSRQCRSAINELLFLAPWLDVPTQLSGSLAGIDKIPRLQDLAHPTENWWPHQKGDAYLTQKSQLTVEKPLNGATPLISETQLNVETQWLADRQQLLCLAQQRAQDRIDAIERLVHGATGFATMDYEFLYDRSRHLLAIGYNVDDLRRDTSYYDLLASEARLCSFVAIAQGQLPQESWFALGRLLTTTNGKTVLASWSGSMFEYLMPLLVMPGYTGSLLDQTCQGVVARQIAYGHQCALPWGISESGYYTTDSNLNYQYHAFGVPGLGLKRGLSEDRVVAPYATALALMVNPEAACTNLQRLANAAMLGRYGFYEAIDYTPSRVPRGQTSVIVQSFMAHHQGMSLLSLAYLLLDRPMQQRFLSDPRFQATVLLLQERIPSHSVFHKRPADHAEGGAFVDAPESSSHTSLGIDTPTPEVQLLSNGRYHVMITNAGGGYSRWKDLAITRWREDMTRDHWGTFIYVRDLASGSFWSAAHQPTLKPADAYEAVFSEGRAEFRRRDQEIETYSEIVVSPEDDIELRRIRFTNRSRDRRHIELTSYAEVVLAVPANDMSQPAFGNLFVQTEIIGNRHAILCTRRPRSAGEKPPWMFHLLSAHGCDMGEISYETDRMRFTGRGRTPVEPAAMLAPGALSGAAGSVLDPIAAIRCSVFLAADQCATIDLVTGVGDTREACMALIEKYQDRHLADRVFDLAWTHGGVTLRQINASESDAHIYRRLASSMLFANANLRAESGLLLQNRRGQSGLWGYAISGDLPIVLLKVADSDHIELARQVIQCHGYWRLKGLVVDLVIWNEEHVGYRQRLQDQILGLIATGTEATAIDRPGGIFVRSAEQISHEDRILLQAVARAIIADNQGSLKEQVSRRMLTDRRHTRLIPTRQHQYNVSDAPTPPPAELQSHQPLGEFNVDGSEYLITSAASQMTPLPWVNVIANPHFGTIVSESGPGYTWSENAHEFRLTPWSDDPVGASGGEAFYLRDEESGYCWSPTPLPNRGATPYVSRHGFGYSVFEHTEDGIRSELWIYVDLNDAVKFSVLKVHNTSGRSRKLSATGYVEWVLGDLRSKFAMHVVTEIDATSGALFARNAYSTEFGDRVAFLDVDDLSRTLTGDRTEFIGRNGTLRRPEAMTRTRLSGKVGAALDPCGAIQVPFELGDGQTRDIIFRLGAGRDLVHARALAKQLRTPGSAHNALNKVRNYWRRTLSAVQVETPDAALNMLTNGWLVYQTLACRLWGRSGFYQSGGAFGFRDQLQDVMALVHAEPALARQHLLRCAGRQYPEGDVQHWWHPPNGRGVRTRCSDDYLWLPLAASRYVTCTGDNAVLNEIVPYLAGRSLEPEEESYYDLPAPSTASGSVYEHCVRAILHGMRFGERGLPLMGSGDWNDGMNLVGIHGKGESVWLGFFLCHVLTSFAPLARSHGDADFAERCLLMAAQLRQNIQTHAWDGEWYRRAWFDDGTPLGSSSNEECRIDSIAQSWSVLSRVGVDGDPSAIDAERSRLAMQSLDTHLVRRESGIVQLLDPPFDTSALNPGYIKGYVPGVRENGGQYTHSAIWAAMAFAALGDSRRAWALLDMINPLNHTRSTADISIYKAEPYVVAADVYAIPPHTGRGGWTWYTGSAGWLYRLILESLLGLQREGDTLRITPCLPEDWEAFSLSYRFHDTHYQIKVMQIPIAQGDTALLHNTLDGIELANNVIPLVADNRLHIVEIRIGRPTVL